MTRIVVALHLLLILIKFLLIIFEKKEPQIFDDYQEEFKYASEF